MLNHSVSSWRSPLLLLLRRLTARENRVKGVPSPVTFISGSLPRLPMSMILFNMLVCFPFVGIKKSLPNNREEECKTVNSQPHLRKLFYSSFRQTATCKGSTKQASHYEAFW